MEPVRPTFEGASIAALVPALVGGHPAPWMPEPVADARAVVLLLLDGLGWNALAEHAGRLPTVASLTGGPITTVVPSTTSTALTSVATGLAPAQHGILGYRMLFRGAVLNVLRWTTGEGPAPDPFDVQRHTAFLGREVPVVTRSEFRASGFTRAHLRGARIEGWTTPAVLVERCRRLVEAGERFVFAYYPGVDTVAHEFGLHAEEYHRELADTDRLVGDLLAALPEWCAVVVTSDHGQVHLDASSWIDVTELDGLVEHYSGDGRFRSLHARPGAGRELLAAARSVVEGTGWAWSRAELLEGGWLGPSAGGSVPGRIGDVVLAAREPVAYVDPGLPTETRLRSGHGSVTPDEMLVPLVAGRGTGPAPPLASGGTRA